MFRDDVLHNISSIDGRYKDKTQKLSKYFSEFALIKKRLFVEIEYIKFLLSNKILPKNYTYEVSELAGVAERFNLKEARKGKKEGKGIKNKGKTD